MPISCILVVLISFLSGAILSFLFSKLALRYNVFTIRGIPIVGGLSMGISFAAIILFSFIFFRNLSLHIIGITVSSLLMLFFGMIDDLRELSVPVKFFIQTIAASVLIFSGVKTNIAYIGDSFNLLITFIWVLGITNAFNLLDIIDGLAAGIGIIAGLSFLVISFLNADTNAVILSLVFCGVVFSFLIYNLPPAKIYMGNSGSHFLGFVLSAIALMISYASLETKIALMSPLFILGFPIFDTMFLIFIRISKRKLPFNKTDDHLALKLLALGYSKRKVLFIMLGLGLFFSLCGVIISKVAIYG